MSLTELIKNLLLPTLFAITFAFLGAEVFYQIQGYRLSLGYWFGMLFVCGFVVVPAILRRLSRAKQPNRGSDA